MTLETAKTDCMGCSKGESQKKLFAQRSLDRVIAECGSVVSNEKPSSEGAYLIVAQNAKKACASCDYKSPRISEVINDSYDSLGMPLEVSATA